MQTLDMMISMSPRTYLDRGCPEGQAAACQLVAAHPWGDYWRSSHDWLLSVGCGPPRPSLGWSHLCPGRREQKLLDLTESLMDRWGSSGTASAFLQVKSKLCSSPCLSPCPWMPQNLWVWLAPVNLLHLMARAYHDFA